jgi:hypothetical protein
MESNPLARSYSIPFSSLMEYEAVLGNLKDALGLSTNPQYLPEEVIEVLFEEKLFKLFIPKSLGGLEKNLPEASRLIEAIAELDGSTAWLVQIGSGGGYFTPFLHPEFCQTHVSSQRFVIAGSGAPAGTGTPNKNELMVSGSWKYASGSEYASLFTAVVKTPDDRLQAIALFPEEVQLHHDWNALGMRATQSHTFSCEDIQIPENRLFTIGEKKQSFDYPVYDFPFDSFARALIVPVVIGCYRHFIEVLYRMEMEKAHRDDYRHLRLLRLIEQSVERSDVMVRHFYEVLDQTWAVFLSGEAMEDEKNKFDRMAMETSKALYRETSDLFYHSGMMAVEKKESEIVKIWNDLLTVCQHYYLKS